MQHFLRGLLLSGASLIAFVAPAAAQGADARVTTLEQQLREMRAEIAELKKAQAGAATQPRVGLDNGRLTVTSADGAFSLVTGAVLILDAASLAALTSPAATPVMMKVVGVGLLIWGIFHLSAARNGGPVTAAARISIAGDVLWQVASLALLLTAYGYLSSAGIALVVIGMIAVMVFV